MCRIGEDVVDGIRVIKILGEKQQRANADVCIESMFIA